MRLIHKEHGKCTRCMHETGCVYVGVNVTLEPMMHKKHVLKGAWLCRNRVYLTHGKCTVHAQKGNGIEQVE